MHEGLYIIYFIKSRKIYMYVIIYVCVNLCVYINVYFNKIIFLNIFVFYFFRILEKLL